MLNKVMETLRWLFKDRAPQITDFKITEVGTHNVRFTAVKKTTIRNIQFTGEITFMGRYRNEVTTDLKIDAGVRPQLDLIIGCYDTQGLMDTAWNIVRNEKEVERLKTKLFQIGIGVKVGSEQTKDDIRRDIKRLERRIKDFKITQKIMLEL